MKKKLKKQNNNITIDDLRNIFRLKWENKVTKNRTLDGIRNLFEHEEEKNYYKSVWVSNFVSNDYIK